MIEFIYICVYIYINIAYINDLHIYMYYFEPSPTRIIIGWASEHEINYVSGAASTQEWILRLRLESH